MNRAEKRLTCEPCEHRFSQHSTVARWPWCMAMGLDRRIELSDAGLDAGECPAGKWAGELTVRPNRGAVDEAERQRRRTLCAECAERDESRGGLHCNLCRVCGDREPWAHRRRCPVFKWGGMR